MRCESCGFENDETRVFCQNCGTRLTSGEKPAAAEAAAPHRYSDRSRNLGRPSVPSFGYYVGRLFREILGIALVSSLTAAVLLMAMAPDNIPPEEDRNTTKANLLAADIQAARASAYPRTLVIPQSDINNFLLCRVQGMTGSGGITQATFQRAYVSLGSGDFLFGVEQRLRTWPIYLQLRMKPEARNGAMTLLPEAGKIGRLQVPKFLLSYFMLSFKSVTQALENPMSWFATARTVTIAPEEATVTWEGLPEGGDASP